MPEREPALAAFARGLRSLRERAGLPGYRELAGRAGCAAPTLSAAAAGRRLPSLAVALAYVTACGGDVVEWEERWRRTAAELEKACDAGRGKGAAPVFGRDKVLAELLRRIAERRFVVLAGPSGCGKSALLRGGVAPRFRSVVLTPGERPVRDCAHAVARLIGVPADVLHREMAADPEALSRALTRAGGEVLIVVDQFEELVARCPRTPERAAFVTALMTAANGPARVVLGARDWCASGFDDVVRVGALTVEDVRQLVVGYTGAASERIIEEIVRAPGLAALLPHAGTSLAETLVLAAECAYQSFAPQRRREAAAALVRLAALGRVPRELAPAVLDELAAARVVVLTGTDAELADPDLPARWRRLGVLDLCPHRGLAAAAAMWVALGREPDALYRGRVLTTAVPWSTTALLSPAEREFLTAGLAAQASEVLRTPWRRKRLTPTLNP